MTHEEIVAYFTENFKFCCDFTIFFSKNIFKDARAKAIETGMILSIMDMKKTLLCIFFKDLYSPR